jgi:hypothetical protein
MADSPAAWVQQIDRLFQDAELRQTLGERGRAFVEEHHHWESCLTPLAALLDTDGPAHKRLGVEANWSGHESRHESLV